MAKSKALRPAITDRNIIKLYFIQGKESDRGSGYRYMSDVDEPDVKRTKAPRITKEGIKLKPVQRINRDKLTGAGGHKIKKGY